MANHAISAVIIARNEAEDLDTCLDSLTWVDEVVIVVDSRSTDATETIALRRANHTIVRTFDNFAGQRNAGIEKATGKWILSIDADERISERLAAEIRGLIHAESSLQAAQIPIQSTILGRTFHYCGTQLDRPIRLFLRVEGEWQGEVHERVSVEGQTVTLNEPILHRSLSTLDEFVTKIHEYTSLEAEKLARIGVRPRPFDLTLRPIVTFLKLYIARRGFLDGVEGLLYCALSAFSVLIRNAKLRELALQTQSHPTINHWHAENSVFGAKKSIRRDPSEHSPRNIRTNVVGSQTGMMPHDLIQAGNH